jgi:hypothetical protein
MMVYVQQILITYCNRTATQLVQADIQQTMKLFENT